MVHDCDIAQRLRDYLVTVQFEPQEGPSIEPESNEKGQKKDIYARIHVGNLVVCYMIDVRSNVSDSSEYKEERDRVGQTLLGLVPP